MLKVYVCSAKVKSINPSSAITDHNGFQFLNKEYRAESKEKALQGFTQYLQDNKNFTTFKDVIVK